MQRAGVGYGNEVRILGRKDVGHLRQAALEEHQAGDEYEHACENHQAHLPDTGVNVGEEAAYGYV